MNYVATPNYFITKGKHPWFCCRDNLFLFIGLYLCLLFLAVIFIIIIIYQYL